jgi:hypothetical protein
MPLRSSIRSGYLLLLLFNLNSQIGNNSITTQVQVIFVSKDLYFLNVGCVYFSKFNSTKFYF